jgi:hypothetical protein
MASILPFTLLLATACSASALHGQDAVRGHLVTFLDNGAWSWFEDERAIVDPLGGQILVGSCADDSGFGGSARGGDIDVGAFDLRTGRVTSFELRDRLQGDDHNSPALMVRPDGRYLAMYGMHGGSGTAPRLSRWRVSTRPGDPTAWEPERSFTHPVAMSYSNLHYLPDADQGRGVTYNFVRAANWDPNVMVSRDLGTTFTGSGKLVTEGGTSDRPYVKYANDGSTRVHVLTTERHPRNFDNSIYHGYVEGGALHDSFGNVIDGNVLDASGQRPTALTRVFTAGTPFGGVVMRRAWTVDIEADDGGVVRALFTARALDRDTDHRLFFGRFDGAQWSVHEVCGMGGYLYAAENDYTGLGALHPDEPDRIFVSTRVDPRSGAALARYEIFDGRTPDQGATWTWTPVTQDSTVDNLRPIVPAWSAGRTALIWFRGTYSTYTSYDTAVVGVVDAPETESGPITYVDATRSNTTLVNGAPIGATGPAAGLGPVDGLWHERTGFGNGGTVLTSDEQGSEDVPMIRTRVPTPPGAYDVFAFFWSNSGQWLVQAGFDNTSLRTFEKFAVEAAGAADFSAPVTLTGSTVQLYKAYLGRVDVPAGGTIDVFVDDLATGQGTTTRTWYDGIGFAPVTTPAGFDEVGRGCRTTATITASAPPVLGGPAMQVSVQGGPTAALAHLLVGIGQAAPLDLGPLGLLGCTLYPDTLATLLLGSINAAGSSPGLPILLPNDPALLRGRLILQAAITGFPAGLGLTPAWIVRMGR